MKEDVYKEALLFAENVGYSSDQEKEHLIYDFTSGANYMLKKMFNLYLCGEIKFDIELIEK